MEIKIIEKPISKHELAKMAQEQFGDFVKAVVDMEKEIMAVGGDMHVDEEQILLQNGSKQECLWGINIFPERPEDVWIEFDSMINIRPYQNNRTRSVDDLKLREKIQALVKKLIADNS